MLRNEKNNRLIIRRQIQFGICGGFEEDSFQYFITLYILPSEKNKISRNPGRAQLGATSFMQGSTFPIDRQEKRNQACKSMRLPNIR